MPNVLPLQTAPHPLTSLGTTVATSILYSLAVYSHKFQKGERFQPDKVIETLIVGLLAGAVFFYFGWKPTPAKVETVAASFGLVAVADHLATVVQRRVSQAAADMEDRAW